MPSLEYYTTHPTIANCFIEIIRDKLRKNFKDRYLTYMSRSVVVEIEVLLLFVEKLKTIAKKKQWYSVCENLNKLAKLSKKLDNKYPNWRQQHIDYLDYLKTSEFQSEEMLKTKWEELKFYWSESRHDLHPRIEQKMSVFMYYFYKIFLEIFSVFSWESFRLQSFLNLDMECELFDLYND